MIKKILAPSYKWKKIKTGYESVLSKKQKFVLTPISEDVANIFFYKLDDLEKEFSQKYIHREINEISLSDHKKIKRIVDSFKKNFDKREYFEKYYLYSIYTANTNGENIYFGILQIKDTTEIEKNSVKFY